MELRWSEKNLRAFAVAAVLLGASGISTAIANCHLAPYKNYPCPSIEGELSEGTIMEGSGAEMPVATTKPAERPSHRDQLRAPAGTAQQGKKVEGIRDGTSNTMMLGESPN